MFRRGVGPTVTPKIMGELQTRVRKAMPACKSGDKTPYSKVMSRFGARMTMLYKEEQVHVQKSNFEAPTTHRRRGAGPSLRLLDGVEELRRRRRDVAPGTAPT